MIIIISLELTSAFSSALLHAGHRVSRSHAAAGSLKTNAKREDIHDIFRSWIQKHPVNMDKVSESSPTFRLLAKEAKFVNHCSSFCSSILTNHHRKEANFKHHPQSVTASSKVHLVRYQMNPTPHWGPAAKANSGKRKREQDPQQQQEPEQQ